LLVCRGDWRIAANFSNQPQEIRLGDERAWHVWLASETTLPSYSRVLALPPESLVILSSKRENEIGITD
jgi:hypothetical protein